MIDQFTNNHSGNSCQDTYVTPVKTPVSLLQNSCQETAELLSRDYNKMLECLSFLLQCTMAIILGTTAYYLYSLIKMAEASINDLLLEVSYEPPKSDIKQQKLIECVLTGNSRQYLSKAYAEEQVNKLSTEKVDKLLSNYEAKLSDQMVKSLGKSIIRMYLVGACAVLGMSNQDALSDDLESDPFLNSAPQRLTCELYSRFSSFLAPLSVGLIMSRHYLSERGIKNGGVNEENPE